jgi:hypothetical protein
MIDIQNNIPDGKNKQNVVPISGDKLERCSVIAAGRLLSTVTFGEKAAQPGGQDRMGGALHGFGPSLKSGT